MKILTIVFLSISITFSVLLIMVKLLGSNSTGLTNDEVEKIWKSKAVIAVEPYSEPERAKPRGFGCYAERYKPKPILLADLPKQIAEMANPVVVEKPACIFNKEDCFNGI